MDQHSQKKKRITEIEKQLLPRLRAMGTVVMVFCILSLAYATFSTAAAPESQTPEGLEASSSIFGPITSPFLTLTPNERKKCFLMAGIFSVIGAGCYILAFRKKKELESGES